MDRIGTSMVFRKQEGRECRCNAKNPTDRCRLARDCLGKKNIEETQKEAVTLFVAAGQ